MICGSEHHLVVDVVVREQFVAALEAHGAAVLSEDAARRYNALASEHGLTPTQLALAFCRDNWRVASTIIGVTTMMSERA